MDFLQFDPTKNNLMSEEIYEASSFLNQGANTGKASSSAFNRLLYQLGTMTKAIADMMALNGYTCDDDSLSVLTTQLDNIMTLNKMTPYATNAALAGYLAKAEVLVKTNIDYIVLLTDMYKTIEMNYSGAGSKTISLPAYTSWDNGAFLKIKNIGTTAVIISATIDGVPKPTLAQNEEITVYCDGLALRGKILKDVSALSAVDVYTSTIASSNTLSLSLGVGTWQVEAFFRQYQSESPAQTFTINGMLVDSMPDLGDPPGTLIMTMFGSTSVVKATAGSINIVASGRTADNTTRIFVIAYRTA